MKHTALVLSVAMLALAGCQDKPKTEAPTNAANAQLPAGHPPVGGMPPAGSGQMPKDATHGGGDPHAGLKPMEVPSAPNNHKGKVLETMNAGGYTYVQIEEKGQKLWAAVMETKVKVGDSVEFPDSQPMVNFQSKSLNRTFDKIIFAPGIKIEGAK